MRAFLRIKEDGTFVKKQLPGWAALLIITLVAGLALGCTYALTIDPINEQNALKAENARKAVLPLADSFQEMPLNVHAAKADGFAGPVYVEYVPDEEGKIASITIGNSAFAETPGFGAKALEPAFADQFIGKSLPLADGDIDLIAGATITSNAVISAVNAAQPKEVLVDWCYAGYQGEEVVGYVAQATVQGFGGPVEVVVGVDTNLTLTGISVGGGNFSETAGLGAKAKDSAFTDQFIGKVLPVSVIKAGGKATESTVDAITSATITSNAVAGAVNTAANHAKGILFPGAEDEIVLPEKPEGVQIYSASAQGFAGPVYAEAAFDAQGKISYFSIGNDQFKETDGFGAKAKEPAYLIQYIGLTADEAKNVDAISGATVTSGAIKSAVEQIAAQSQGAAPSAPAEDNTTGAAAAAGEVKSASAQGYAGPVYVEVTLDAEGKIASLKIGDDQFAETPFLGGKVKEAAFTDQFTGKVPPLALSDIDAVANATITSQAVVNAINAACGTDAAAAPAVDAVTDATSAATGAAAPAGEVKSASAQGYAGPVYVEVTLDAEGKIASLKIGDDQFAETPFLGGKVKEAAFTDQFTGKVPPLALSDIDAVANATITSQAVVNAINAACGAEAAPAVDAVTDATSAATGAAAAAGDVKSASAQGYAGPVYVEVTLDAEGKIASLKIGDDQFAETPFLGGKVKEAAFTDQFTGKVPPIALSDIDAVANATITSQAVVNAINAACGTDAAAAPAVDAVTDATSAATGAAAAAGEVKSASAQGYAGPVYVEVTLDAEGKIASLKIGDDQFAETPFLGGKVKEAAFTDQFTGKVPPIALSDIDAVANATITSQAVVNAINAACGADAAAPAVDAVTDATSAATSGAEVPAAAPSDIYTGEAQGYAGPVYVEITVDDQNRIASLKIGDDRFNETPFLGGKVQNADFTNQFIGKEPPLALSDIDAIANATLTSQAVVDAVNQAYEASRGGVAAPDYATYSASAQGYAGPVAVSVTLDGNTIVSIAVGDENFAETSFLGGKAKEDAFTAQFAGKALPIALSDIDAITNATITSQAVVDAINAAYALSQAQQ